MQFLYPGFLWALLAITIPVIIHLFNFRKYKTIYFSNVQLLQSIRKESKSRSNLKNLLILLLRMLAIIFLVIAFAQPYKPVSENNTTKNELIVGVYVDNSFSMDAKGKYGVLLEQAKMKAREIANAYSYNTKFLLTTNNFELKHQQLVNKEQFVDWVSQIQPTHIIHNIPEIINRQQQVLNTNDTSLQQVQYLLSDFQKQISKLSEYPKNQHAKYILVPFKSESTNNIFIDSVWFATPGHYLNKKEELLARVVNASENELTDLQVNLFINDSLKALATINIDANSNTEVSLPFIQTLAGYNLAKVELADYPITFDNTLFFNYYIGAKIKVLCLNGDNALNNFKALYYNDENFEFQEKELKTMNYDLIHQHQYVILNGLIDISSGLALTLKEFVNNGNRLLIIPSKNINISGYQQLLNLLDGPQMLTWKVEQGIMNEIDFNNVYFKESVKKDENNIRMPDFSGFYSIKQKRFSKEITILESESGNPLLIQQNFGQGDFVLFNLPLDKENTNFATHPLFVPLLYNLGLYCVKLDVLYNTLRPNLQATSKTNKTSGLFKLQCLANTNEIIPTTQYSNGMLKVFVDENMVQAGQYKLINEEEMIANFSFNFDRNESTLHCYSFSELQQYIEASPVKNIDIIKGDTKHIQQNIKHQTDGKPYSIIFLWLLLATVLAEVLILKLA